MSNAVLSNETDDLRSRFVRTNLRAVSDADGVAGERKFIWPLAATLMLIVLAWALATEFRLPPEQRAALFAVQSQAGP